MSVKIHSQKLNNSRNQEKDFESFYEDSRKFSVYSMFHSRYTRYIYILILVILTIIFSWNNSVLAILGYGIFLCNTFFKLFLIIRSRNYSYLHANIGELLHSKRNWPYYTILVPLLREEEILPQLILAMNNIIYPKNRLEILILVEENDDITKNALAQVTLPSHFSIIEVKYSLPLTKPKACNYALEFARGEYVVIYDAEDIPDPLQLKKAVTSFEALSDEYVCVQAKLSFYNYKRNFLTQMFQIEYQLWFSSFLPGMISSNIPIPLGGTSNHIRMSALKEMMCWDPYNVTEDADLGFKIAHFRYKTYLIASHTFEEAPFEFRNWTYQRTRWIKGHIQTSLHHMINWRNQTKSRIIFSILFIFLPILSYLLAPILILTYNNGSIIIDAILLFSIIVSYIITAFIAQYMHFSFVKNQEYQHNFLAQYQHYNYEYNKKSSFKILRWLLYGIHAVIFALYHILHLYSAIRACIQIYSRPFYWNKTRHYGHQNN